MILFPNCKINLGLSVTKKRSDGYHDIESVFYPINLCDALEVVKAEANDFHLYGQEVPGEAKDNLVLKAWQLMNRYHPETGPVNIALLKHIPTGAGLGGGSADAAFMLRILNKLFSLELTLSDLESYALELGSDCPFFIRNVPSLARGRGEHLQEINLQLGNHYFVLVKPDIHISTPWAFRQIVPQKQPYGLEEVIRAPLTDWKKLLINDFELPVFETYPSISKIREKLYEYGAVYASLSGTGSVVYGIFDQEQSLEVWRKIFRDSAVFICKGIS